MVCRVHDRYTGRQRLSRMLQPGHHTAQRLIDMPREPFPVATFGPRERRPGMAMLAQTDGGRDVFVVRHCDQKKVKRPTTTRRIIDQAIVKCIWVTFPRCPLGHVVFVLLQVGGRPLGKIFGGQ